LNSTICYLTSVVKQDYNSNKGMKRKKNINFYCLVNIKI
jgi:hypothetical protein